MKPAVSATGKPDQVLANAGRTWLRVLSMAAIGLLVLLSLGLLVLQREEALEKAKAQAQREVKRLEAELSQSLRLAEAGIGLLNGSPGLAKADLISDFRPLIEALSIPFELQLTTPAKPSTSQASLGVWVPGLAQQLAGRWYLPLIWQQPAANGGQVFELQLSRDAILKRFASEGLPAGGSMTLFRLEDDGATTVLVRYPMNEREQGLKLRGHVADALARAPSGVFLATARLDNIHRVVSYQQLGEGAQRLVIVYAMSVQGVLAGWTANLPWALALTLLVVTAMAYGAWRLDRTLLALSVSEKRFELFLQSGNVWDWDLPKDRMRFAPRFLQDMGFGLVPQEKLGQTLFDVMEPEDAKRLRLAMRAHIVHNSAYMETFRVRDARGDMHWFETQGQAFRDKTGRVTFMAGTTVDVTERRALAESQRQTLQQLDTVANASPVLFWTTDLQGQLDWVNQCWVDFTGRSMSDVLRVGLAPDVHPDDAAQRHNALQLALENHQPYALEYRLRHHSGEFRCVVEQCLLRLDADQQPVGFIGSCVDISELKRAEDTVRARGAMLESVFEVLHDRLFVLDINNRFVQYHGLEDEGLYVPSDVFLGKTIAEVVPSDAAVVIEHEMQKARLGTVCDFEYTLNLPQLGQRIFNARGARIPNSDHCMLLTRDITEREVLRQQQQRLHRFMRLQASLASGFINLPVEQIDDGIDRALADIGAFVSADRAYIFAYDVARGVAVNTHEWCSTGIESVQAELQALPIEEMLEWDFHRVGRFYTVEDVTQLAPGPTRDMLERHGIQSMATLPMVAGDVCLGFVGFDSVQTRRTHTADDLSLLLFFAQMLVNLTERRTTEAKLRGLTTQLEQRVTERTQQLDLSVKRLSQANRELESFAYSVSHDLKSPLRSVEGFASLLLQEHSVALSEDARHCAVRIQRATLHMARLISDLLAYCRIEELGQGLVALRLADSASEVLAGMHNELEAQQARVRVNLPSGLVAMAHPQGLAMVLRNLIDNAMKFTRPGQTPEIEIEAHTLGPLVRLSVRDRGMGFEMKHHDRIFAIFQRLHRPDQIAGTGIGLAMVHKAVERMDGRIWAQSAPGEGATFNIELPRA